MRKFIVFLILVILGFVFFPYKSQALTISPVKFNLSADPGDTINGEITLINSEKWQMVYYSTVESVTTRGSHGEPVFTGEKYGLANWITVSPSKVILNPGKQIKTSFTIELPEDAEPGGHYAVIFWGTTPPEGEETGSGLGIASRMGILVLLSVSGEVTESGEIVSFTTGKKLSNYLPINFHYNLKNTGSVHIRPEGKIIVKNIFGKTVAILSINPQRFNVLPNVNRSIDVAWASESSTNEIKGEGFLTELKKEKAGFGLGYYRAVLNLEFGKEAQSLESSLGFWVLPWRILLLSFLFLGGGFFALAQGIKRYNSWIINKARGQINPKKSQRKP